MLTVAGVNVEKEAGERIDSPASDAFSVLYPIPLDKREFGYLFRTQLYRTADPSGYSMTILSSEKPHFR